MEKMLYSFYNIKEHVNRFNRQAFRVGILTCFLLINGWIYAQNNVGIGTDSIHVSALLQIKDTTKGLLIPRTDTNSVNAYVNSLFPNPGITDGLIIYDETDNNYFYYDGNLSMWVAMNRLKGPIGDVGPEGPKGPTGFGGRSTNWRDSAFADPVRRVGDTCGDFYHQTGTGLIWEFNCDSNDWVGPIARWRNLGYGEQFHRRAFTLIYKSMPTTPGPANLSLIDGLTALLRVPPDTMAHVTITSQGMIQKRESNDSSYNYVKFDFFLDPPTGPGAYLDHSQTVAVNPNIPLAGDPNGVFDKVHWNITTSFNLEGKISPPGNPLPASDFLSWTIETHAGQRNTLGHPTPIDTRSDVIICDGGNGKHGLWENYAVMNVYIVFERSINAPYPE